MRPERKPVAKLLATFLSLTVLLFLAGCGNGNGSTPTTSGKPAKAPAAQQVYRSPLVTSDIATFDPGQSTDLASIAAVDMVFTGLVSENDQLQVQGQLAKSWESSPDGLTWTFHLKPNLQFSDGTPLTSQDVAYSIDRALSPEISNLNGVSLTYLGLIKGAEDRVNGKIASIIGSGIEAPDTNTVVIHITNPAAYFLEALTYPTGYVVEKKVIDQWGLKWTDHLSDNNGQGGSGPFVVQKYDHGTGITFVPNPKYYGAQPQLKRVEFPFVKDSNTNYLEYQAGQLDTTAIPTADYTQASAMTNQFRKIPLLDIFFYGMNYLAKPLNNIHIRQALELAINKDVIAQSIWSGQVIPTNHIVPKGMPGYAPNLTGPEGAGTKGDTAKAKALFQQGLQEEGLTLATFPTIRVTFSNTSQDSAREVTTLIQMWNQVLGITSIKPDPVDRNKLFASIRGTANNDSLQMWRVDWSADYPDPQDWITLLFAKDSPRNNENYGQNQSATAAQQQANQQAMLQADGISDQTTRMQAYNKIEQQLINDVAWLPIFQSTSTYLLKPYVIGVVDNPLSITPPDDWGNIYIAKH